MSGPHSPGSDSGLPPRIFWTAWIACLAAWMAVLALAAPWDLPLSAAVVDRDAVYGKLVLWFGEWPGWLAVAASLVILILGRRLDSPLRPYRPLAGAILLLAIIQPLLITQSLKFLWGRVRFRDLGAAFAGFTPFYIPAGLGAGRSFPSGHVAMASVLTPVVFYLGRRRGLGVATLALLPVLVVSMGVAWGRLLSGAHYLTDCVFSAGLSFLLAAVVVRRLAGA